MIWALVGLGFVVWAVFMLSLIRPQRLHTDRSTWGNKQSIGGQSASWCFWRCTSCNFQDWITLTSSYSS